MFWAKNSQRITKYFLLSFLSFGLVFSAPTETALEPEDVEDVGKYGGDEEDILRFDFFDFTTRKRYIWEDWTVAPRDPADFGEDDSPPIFLLYFVIPVVVTIFAIFLVYICIKNLNNGCCSAESNSFSSRSTDRFTTVHRPPQRTTYLSTQVHRLPTERNQFSASRRELSSLPARTDLFNELDSNRGVTDEGRVTIPVIHSTYSGPYQGGREPRNAGTPDAEKPPDYSTVTLNDLVNPTMPAFPAVKRDNETPPPEYGKENPLFK